MCSRGEGEEDAEGAYPAITHVPLTLLIECILYHVAWHLDKIEHAKKTMANMRFELFDTIWSTGPCKTGCKLSPSLNMNVFTSIVSKYPTLP